MMYNNTNDGKVVGPSRYSVVDKLANPTIRLAYEKKFLRICKRRAAEDPKGFERFVKYSVMLTLHEAVAILEEE